MPQPQLAQELESFIRSQEGSLLFGESTAESRVLRASESLLNELRVEGGFVGVSIRDLMKTKRTIGDVANWEFGGSNFQSAYKHLNRIVDTAIENSLEQVSPGLREVYEQLNAEYAAYKDMFENKNLKAVFEPQNHNYNSIANDFVTNADKLRSLEDIFYENPRGQEVVNQVKRDFAQKVVNRPNVTSREINDMRPFLGPQFNDAVDRFVVNYQHAMDHPLPRILPRNPLGIEVPISQGVPSEAGSLKGRAKKTGVLRAENYLRGKMYEALSKESPDKIMRNMETISGIRKLKEVLQTTKEGRKLFKRLARYKISELIDKNMADSVTGELKFGKFSGLLDKKKSQDIVKELLGKESFQKLSRLQKLTGELNKSASKFLNTSQSGTSLTDMGLIGAATTGILTGNGFIALPALVKIGGSKLVASLLADPKFLQELENAVLTKNGKKFLEYLKKMKPHVKKAFIDLQNDEQPLVVENPPIANEG
jgi:hypothetical protein